MAKSSSSQQRAAIVSGTAATPAAPGDGTDRRFGPGPGRNPKYIDLDTLKTSEGLMAIISLRTSTNTITFALMREYFHDGVAQRTQFIPEEYLPALKELVEQVIERCAQLRAEGLDRR